MLSGETAVVTGATNGIGRQIAITFAEQGSDVIVADVDVEPMFADRPTHEVIREVGSQSEFIETDVSDRTKVERLFAEVDDRYPNLDILVNNAGIASMDNELLNLDLEDWQQIIDVNLTGTYLCSKYAMPALIENDGGCIINISSTGGLLGSEGLVAYGASKAGVTNMTKVLALDYGRENIRVNSIHPSPIQTPGLKKAEEGQENRDGNKTQRIVDGVPLGRIGSPEDVAGAAVFLASDLASYVSGHALVVDGGLMAKYY